MMFVDERSGGCLCGAVRFVAAEAEAEFGGCHCKMCQRWAGSALLAVSVPASAVRFDGAGFIGRHASSDWAERAWCTRCGSSLWFRATGKDSYEIPIGAFDDTSGFRMTREIWIDRKPDAYAFAGEHPRETEAEVLARYDLKTAEPR